MKKTAIITLSILTILGMSSYAQADHRHGSSNNYTEYTTTVTEHNDDCPDEIHSHSYSHRGYRNHHRHHATSHHGYGHHQTRHVYVEKHVYTHQAPRVTYQQTYRTHTPQPTYSQPRRSYSTHSNHYQGDVVGDTVIGGAFGAAAGAAFGRGLLW